MIQKTKLRTTFYFANISIFAYLLQSDKCYKKNQAFYAKNSQVKSIDSKNKEQVKAWKKIYKEFEAKCQ